MKQIKVVEVTMFDMRHKDWVVHPIYVEADSAEALLAHARRQGFTASIQSNTIGYLSLPEAQMYVDAHK